MPLLDLRKAVSTSRVAILFSFSDMVHYFIYKSQFTQFISWNMQFPFLLAVKEMTTRQNVQYTFMPLDTLT